MTTMTPEEMQKARVNKLRALVEQDGGPAEFARKRSKIGGESGSDKPIDPTYISQILNSHRSFGERSAINMAKRAGLPHDYFLIATEGETERKLLSAMMDSQQYSTLEPEEKRLVEAFRAANADAREAMTRWADSILSHTFASRTGT